MSPMLEAVHRISGALSPANVRDWVGMKQYLACDFQYRRRFEAWQSLRQRPRDLRQPDPHCEKHARQMGLQGGRRSGTRDRGNLVAEMRPEEGEIGRHAARGGLVTG